MIRLEYPARGFSRGLLTLLTLATLSAPSAARTAQAAPLITQIQPAMTVGTDLRASQLIRAEDPNETLLHFTIISGPGYVAFTEQNSPATNAYGLLTAQPGANDA